MLRPIKNGIKMGEKEIKIGIYLIINSILLIKADKNK